MSLSVVHSSSFLAAVLSIGAVYDWLWRPDPLRFSFWFNLASDGFIIVLHLSVAAAVVWLARRSRGKTKAAPTES